MPRKQSKQQPVTIQIPSLADTVRSYHAANAPIIPEYVTLIATELATRVRSASGAGDAKLTTLNPAVDACLAIHDNCADPTGPLNTSVSAATDTAIRNATCSFGFMYMTALQNVLAAYNAEGYTADLSFEQRDSSDDIDDWFEASATIIWVKEA